MTLRADTISAKTPSSDTEREWWKSEPLSILELADPLHVAAHGRDGFDPARVVKRMRDLNATAAHVFPLGCHLDGETLFFKHGSPGDPVAKFDYLTEWLQHSIPAKVRTIVYFNVHSVKGSYANKHPQWQAQRFDGSPKEDVYNIESTFCVNSPWRDWVFARLGELCEYPIDGIFFDGPVFFDDCCYCRHCREQFTVHVGEAMPPMDQIGSPRYPALVEFRAQSIARFVRESRDIIKAVREGILFYVNANPLQPSRLTARDNRKLAKCQDVLASEGGFLGGDLMTESPIWKVGMNAKLLETQASEAGVPHLVFDSLIHTPWTYYTLPAAEARLLWASSVAHGAGTWMSAYKDSLNRPAVSAIGELYEFARRHRDALFETQSMANVAVVVSAATLNYYAGADVAQTDFTAARSHDLPGNVTRELYGWYHALWVTHTPFDLIDEVTLERGKLAGYRVIVLPNVACLSNASVDRLREFAASGGTLIVSFQTGFADENGVRRASPALDDVLGVDRSSATVQGSRPWDYLFDPARSGVTKIEACMPSPQYGLSLDPKQKARSILTFSKPLPDRYAGLPDDSGLGAVFEHSFGRGRAFYFACDIGAAMWKWRLPEHMALLRALVIESAQPPLQLRDAPPCLDVSLRRSTDGSRVFVNLVNYNGGMSRPIQRVIPLTDITVKVLGRAVAARALFDEHSIPIEYAGPWSSVRLSRLGDFESIELQMK